MFYIKIVVEIANIDITPPRQGDKSLMQAFEDEGFSPDDLKLLNRTRLHQQALFVSDILLGANGRAIDPKYIKSQELGDNWSYLVFPEVAPSQSDFDLWVDTIHRATPQGRVALRVGRFHHVGHKIWDWRYLASEHKLLRGHQDEGTVDVYLPSTPERGDGASRRYLHGEGRSLRGCRIELYR